MGGNSINRVNKQQIFLTLLVEFVGFCVHELLELKLITSAAFVDFKKCFISKSLRQNFANHFFPTVEISAKTVLFEKKPVGHLDVL